MASSLKESLLPRCGIVTVLFLAVFLGRVAGEPPVVSVTCRKSLDLNTTQYKAGVLVSTLPDRIPDNVTDAEKCDIKLSVATGTVLMIYFDRLDFYAADTSTCNTTNIQLFDGSVDVRVSGLDRPICGSEEQKPSGVFFIERGHLIIRVSALGVYRGTGFRIHFTVSRRAYPCMFNEFACETFGARRCIVRCLVCDGWNDCGDSADEQQNCTTSTSTDRASHSVMASGTESGIAPRSAALYLTLFLCVWARVKVITWVST